MKRETGNWFRQAKEDLDSARYCFKGRKFSLTAFLCQQSAEKALKAMLIERTSEFPKIHDLTKLARMLNSPKEIFDMCASINPAYIATRYHDSPQKYSKDDCIKILKYSEDVIKWTKKNLR